MSLDLVRRDLGAHWRAILLSLLFAGATLVAGRKGGVSLQGQVMTAGGILALLMPIISGWLSDRTTSRWGRRRPWMVAGKGLAIALYESEEVARASAEARDRLRKEGPARPVPASPVSRATKSSWPPASPSPSRHK